MRVSGLIILLDFVSFLDLEVQVVFELEMRM
jgi:hypothetical protein